MTLKEKWHGIFNAKNQDKLDPPKPNSNTATINKCPHCGVEIAADANRCIKCGTVFIFYKPKSLG